MKDEHDKTSAEAGRTSPNSFTNGFDPLLDPQGQIPSDNRMIDTNTDIT